MATRRNILSSAKYGDDFVKGVKLLKAEIPAGGTLSTYDTFVVWHHRAMMTLTPASQGERNAAHSGPVFLPWHRFMLSLFEANLQRVLGDASFGLPYWDWAADGGKAAAKQKTAKIWKLLGGDGAPITTGPFAQGQWAVRVEQDLTTGNLVKVNRGLNRAFGQTAPKLPTKARVTSALKLGTYDSGPWDRASAKSFRNRLEGWDGGSLHNGVHVWVGGDMLASTSPNDPVFYLNHCNVDRLWSQWQTRFGATTYAPVQADASAPARHRPNDALFPMQAQSPKVKDMFDVSGVYTYA
jgi:tyrosinase